MWDLPLRSAALSGLDANATTFAIELTHNGGTGARPGADGLSATVSLHFARAGGYDLDAIPDEHRMRHYCGYAGLGILYRTDLHGRLGRRSIHPRPAGGKVAPDS